MFVRKRDFLQAAASMIPLPFTTEHALSLQEQEDLYAASFSLYQTGNYKESADFFTQLAMCDPFCEKYWRGLASCRQMEKKYQEALHAWSLCALLSAEDPLPHFHAAECLISLRDKEEALKALTNAEELLENDSAYCALRDKIELLKQIHTTL